MPLSTVLGAQSLVQPAVCTTATRPASPYTGQAIYDTTTASQLIWNGTAWTGTGSLVLLTAVTFTAQTTVAFANSLFSASYQNYQVYLECDPVSSTSNWTMQLRNNSGVLSSAAYYGGVIATSFSGSTVNVGTNALTSFNFGSATTDGNNIAMTVFNPFNSVRNTTWSGTTFNNGTNDMGGSFGGVYLGVAVYTGLQFNFSTSVTGTYRVYGLADS